MENDDYFDRVLKIKTCGRDDSISNYENFPYEPTSYLVLQRLIEQSYFSKKNTLLDYGCGKGRVDFYLTYECGCKSIGIDYNERILQRANDNLKSFNKRAKISFVHANACCYEVNDFVDRIYFFNPFCVDVLKIVINNIKKSYDNFNRELLLFFYYPSTKYLNYLNELVFLSKIDEINCMDLFNTFDSNERIIVYKFK